MRNLLSFTVGRLGELEIPCRMPCLIAGLSLKLSFDPHFVSLPSRVAPAGLVAGEWDVPLQSPQAGMQVELRVVPLVLESACSSFQRSTRAQVCGPSRCHLFSTVSPAFWNQHILHFPLRGGWRQRSLRRYKTSLFGAVTYRHMPRSVAAAVSAGLATGVLYCTSAVVPSSEAFNSSGEFLASTVNG